MSELRILPADISPPGDCLDREAAADEVFERWTALDAPLTAALRDAGLVLDDADGA
jgi:hypothetical protein